MNKHSFRVNIEAVSEAEAMEKLQAAVTLIGKLKTTEIKRLADIVKNDPIKTAIARKALGL